MTAALAASLGACAVDSTATTRPHRPVLAGVVLDWSALKVWAWTSRACLARQPDKEVEPRSFDWAEVRRRVWHAQWMARSSTRASHIRHALDNAYLAWVELAAKQIAHAGGTELEEKKVREFGRAPRIRLQRPRTVGVRDYRDESTKAADGRAELLSVASTWLSCADNGVHGLMDLVMGRHLNADGDCAAAAVRSSENACPLEEAVVYILDHRHEYRQNVDGLRQLVRARLQGHDLAGMRDKAAEQQRCARAAAWKQWSRTAMHGGAGRAHRWTKVRDQWVPAEVDGEHDHRTSLPSQLIAAERRRLADLWGADNQPLPAVLLPVHLRVPLPRLTVEQLRRAAKRFSTTTAAGFDGLAPCMFAMLEDEGLELFALLWEAIEIGGVLPRALGVHRVALIPKKDGKWRGIGIFMAAVRLYTRARMDLCQDWEAHHAEPFLPRVKAQRHWIQCGEWL